MGLSGLSSFHFLHPAWLICLAPMAMLTVWMARAAQRRGDWTRAIAPHLLPLLRKDEDGRRASLLWWLIGSIWALTVLALAGPAWNRISVPGYHSPVAWVLVFDLSPSMARNDVPPDRATRARYAAADLLLAAHGSRVGLIAFAGEAHTVAPLTTDVPTIRTLLQPLSPKLMPEAGDNLAPALREAQRLLKAGYAPKGRVVVLSDGFSDPAAAFSEAGRLRKSGFRVDVVGVGQQAAASSESDELQRAAAAGGGMFVSLNDLPALVKQLEGLQSTGLIDESDGSAGALKQWRNEGIWLLIPIALLGIILARRGWV